jgi:hypothetical protein
MTFIEYQEKVKTIYKSLIALLQGYQAPRECDDHLQDTDSFITRFIEYQENVMTIDTKLIALS